MKPNFVNSFDPYTVKVEEARQRRRRRCIFFSTAATLAILILIIGLAAGLSSRKKSSKHSPSLGTASTLAATCSKTAFPDTCVSSLSQYAGASSAYQNPKDMVMLAMNVSLDLVSETLDLIQDVGKGEQGNATAAAALKDCTDTMYDTRDQLTLSMAKFSSLNLRFLDRYTLDDMHTWLSSALTFYSTCFDGLEEIGGRVATKMETKGQYVQQVITNSLSFFVAFTVALRKAHLIPPQRRRLLWVDEGFSDHKRRRHLLQQQPPEINRNAPNAVVSVDGSSKYSSIQEAVNAAPSKSKNKYVIYIKEGVYPENVVVPKTATGIVFIGDGINRSIIRGNRSVAGGSTTFNSATVAIAGKNFSARDLSIENVAGPKGNQAVALRVSADEVAFFRCSFHGYQDTLYAHSNRQFYKNCIIYGTVDFIFGNAAAVFQDCDIIALLPDSGQRNMLTAQGRISNLQNTGYSFHKCDIRGTPELEGQRDLYPTYLGRPWKDYSTTVFLECRLGSIVHPSGWSEWQGAPSQRLTTLFYGEYMNIGDGAAIERRVNWSSSAMSRERANDFTVTQLISGLEWIPGSQVTFTPDLQ